MPTSAGRQSQEAFCCVTFAHRSSLILAHTDFILCTTASPPLLLSNVCKVHSGHWCSEDCIEGLVVDYNSMLNPLLTAPPLLARPSLKKDLDNNARDTIEQHHPVPTFLNLIKERWIKNVNDKVSSFRGYICPKMYTLSEL